MQYQVQSYNMQTVLSTSLPDTLPNILYQLNNQTIWIIDQPLKNEWRHF